MVDRSSTLIMIGESRGGKTVRPEEGCVVICVKITFVVYWIEQNICEDNQIIRYS
jgi:hypothetical protein